MRTPRDGNCYSVDSGTTAELWLPLTSAAPKVEGLPSGHRLFDATND